MMIIVEKIRCPKHQTLEEFSDAKLLNENEYMVMLKCGCGMKIRINLEVI